MNLVRTASIIGSGPNGLAAAITMAQAGFGVDVYEAETVVGGASRTLPLTLPGFRHDFGSAVHPLAAGSPFFQSLPLAGHGLEWVHGLAPLAHPLDDGTAITLERNIDEAARELGEDGKPWKRIVEPLATQWPAFADEILGPLPHIPKRPLLLARFGLYAFLPATSFSRLFLRSDRAGRCLRTGGTLVSKPGCAAELRRGLGARCSSRTRWGGLSRAVERKRFPMPWPAVSRR